MSTAGAVRAAQHVYDSTGLMGDYVMVARDRYTVVGRDEDGHTRLHDVPRRGRMHDAAMQVSESLDALFRSFRLGTRNTNQPGRGRDSMTFPQRSMITELRGGPGPLALDIPTTITVRDAAPARKRRPEPEREPEDEILSHLDTLGAVLLKEFPAFSNKLIRFDSEVREMVEARRKARESEAAEEFERLSGECRTALAKVESLEGERNQLREDLNRLIAQSNGARQRKAAIERAKPRDDEFPTRAQIAEWQQRYAKARKEAQEAEAAADALRADIRAKGAGLAVAKSELAALKERRNAARRLSEKSPEQDITEESIKLHA